jgi:uncharacterized membrane protein (DUF485 family)
MENYNTEQFLHSFDLRNASCDSLHLLLSSAKDEVARYMRCHEQVERCEDCIKKDKEKIKLLQQFQVLKAICCTALIIVAILFILMYSNVIKVPYIDIVVPICICIAVLSFVINFACNVQIKNFKTTNIEEYKTELLNLREKEQETIDEFKAVLFIPETYCYEYALSEMLQFIDDKRANSWKEVTALYEEHLHRRNMEDAAIKIAENSRLQAEYARQTRDATRVAAAGAWAATAGILRK